MTTFERSFLSSGSKVSVEEIIEFTRKIARILYWGLDPKLKDYTVSYYKYSYIVRSMFSRLSNLIEEQGEIAPVVSFRGTNNVLSLGPSMKGLYLWFNITNHLPALIPISLLHSAIWDGIIYHMSRTAQLATAPLRLDVLTASVQLLNDMVDIAQPIPAELQLPIDIIKGVEITITISVPRTAATPSAA